MANWNNPTITTQYDVFVNEAKDRDVDAATLFLNAPTNPITGMVKMLRVGGGLIRFQEIAAGVFVDRVIDIPGGGTGATTAGAARTALGIGTLGVQNSNTISVTGGQLVGLSDLETFCSHRWGSDNSYDLGTFAIQTRKGYFKSALVIPVGVDKYATS